MPQNTQKNDAGQQNRRALFAVLVLGLIVLGIATGVFWIAGITMVVLVVWYWTFGPGRGHRVVQQRRQTRGLEWVFGRPSKVVPKPGWWQASDGKWYPPHQHPRNRRLPPPPP
jgi:hypothetical protein